MQIVRLAVALIAAGVYFDNSGIARSASNEDFVKCAAISGSVERLECYDTAVDKGNLIKPTVSSANKGKWVVQTEISKIDDSKNVSALLESNNEFGGRYNTRMKASFFIVCRENSTQVYFVFGDHFMSDIQGYGDITVRIDKEKARTISTNVSTDNSALGLWRGAGVGFAKSLIGKDSLLAQATPFNESSITAEFSISGIGEAIEPLRKACGW